ncbi:hypothetical protein L8P93_25715, partial [Enterobacter kobei]|uniref:hypothetical protein n=1 Tax=Enterobacter kobei TaxID=208224 RepID=UPI002005AA93
PAPEQSAAQHPHGQHRNKTPLTSPAPAPEQSAAQHPHGQHRNKTTLTSPAPAPEQNAAHLTRPCAGTKRRSPHPP